MKYIFIDSNQYRHLFSLSEGFSDSVYELLIKLIDSGHIALLLPQQTREEVERNRYRHWPEGEIKKVKVKIDRLQKLLEKRKDDLGNYKAYNTLKKEIGTQVKKLEKEKKRVIATFTNNRSKPNQKLRGLFQKAAIINETNKIRELARTRHEKGNPPYSDNIGDSLIWESLLNEISNSKKANLIFVANDKPAWGRFDFDQILREEFKKVCKGKVFYINRLSDIPDLTSEEEEKIKAEEFENLKRNAINDFVNSRSFVGAGRNTNKLLSYKEALSTEDYLSIITASLENYEIYQSFFTATPLKELVSGENGYVVREIEGIDSETWIRFCKQYGISLKRQADQKEEVSLEEEGIPF